MKKEDLQPLSGFRDLLGPDKPALLSMLENIFKSYGYINLETPILEREEILLSQYGNEAQKLLYLFTDNGGRKVGLRYDLTLPLSRFIANNYQSLCFPLKRYEIGPAFRAEKPQKGRYRQFTQADIDIIGSDSIDCELEMLSIVNDVAKELNLKINVKINSRKIANEIFAYLKIDDSSKRKLMILLDKKDKLNQKEFDRQLNELSLKADQKKSFNSIFTANDRKEIEAVLKNKKEWKNIQLTINWAKKIGLNSELDLSLMRGIDYYTGIVFECQVENYPLTLAAGGRYDNLIGELGGKSFSAVGISFGPDRLVDVLETVKTEPQVFIANLPETSEKTQLIAKKMREKNQLVEVFLDREVELGKQIKYADKRKYKNIFIPFPEVLSKGKIVEKDLKTGKQEEIEIDKI